ncbi:hypothetical protein FRB91_007973 [Serendipita sp. 411]|nr:hypothetical protein FRB91_007973 [Serendipita sp. 411]
MSEKHLHDVKKDSSDVSLKEHNTAVAHGGAGVQFDEKRTKNLLWKLDRNIVPFLALLYLLSFLVGPTPPYISCNHMGPQEKERED